MLGRVGGGVGGGVVVVISVVAGAKVVAADGIKLVHYNYLIGHNRHLWRAFTVSSSDYMQRPGFA